MSSIDYTSLVEGEGRELFGDSWKVFAEWFSALDSMQVPAGHKLWALLSYSSMLTNQWHDTVYIPRLGEQRLNLGVVYVGQVSTVVHNLIDLVTHLCHLSDIPLAPHDTDGQRQGLIQALQGYTPAKRKSQAISIGPPTKKKEAKKSPVSQHVAKILAKANQAADGKDVKADALKQFAEMKTESIKADWVDDFEIPSRPTAIILSQIRTFLKDANADLSNLLVHCLLGRTIDIQQQQHRYLIPSPYLSLLGAGRPDDFLGRGGYVNHPFLANIIPVFCGLDDGSSHRQPSGEGYKKIHALADTLCKNREKQVQLQLASDATATFNKLAEIQLQTLDLNMAGMADRRVHMLVKIAGIIAVLRNSNRVNSQDLELSNLILLLNETSVHKAYAGLLAEKSDARLFMRVLEFIDAHGSATIAEVAGYLNHITSMREQEIADFLGRFLSAEKVHEEGEGRLVVSHQKTDMRLSLTSKELRSRLV